MSQIIKSLWEALPDWIQFGGHPDKKNYMDRPVSNPQTQTDAKEYASLALAGAQLAATGAFAVLSVSLGSATNSLLYYRGQHKVGNQFGPVVSETATGTYKLKWPALLTDQLGRNSAINLGTCIGAIDYQDTAAFSVVSRARVIAADEIEITIRKPSDNTLWSGLVGMTILVWSL